MKVLSRPPQRLPVAPRRILAIKNKHIGDVICVLPALRALHRQFPEAKLDVIVSPNMRDLLHGLPWLNEIYEVPKKGGGLARLRAEWKLFRQVAAAGYDLVVDFTWSDRAMWYALASRAKDRWAIQVTAGFFLKPHAYTNYGGKPDRAWHVVEHEREFLVQMGLTPYTPEFEFPPTDAEEATMLGWLEANGIDPRKLVVVHPTSRWLFKCWHDERVAGVVDWLAEQGWQPVFTCGPSEPELAKARAILKLVRTKTATRFGDLTLRELAALLRQARFFFGMDSAPMHLAAAVGTPAVVLFGPSQVARWRPYGARHQVIVSECPCLTFRSPRCDKAQVTACLSKLSLAQVQGVIEQHFSSPDSKNGNAVTGVRVLSGEIRALASKYSGGAHLSGVSDLKYFCDIRPASSPPISPDVHRKTCIRPNHRLDPPRTVSPLCAPLPRRL